MAGTLAGLSFWEAVEVAMDPRGTASEIHVEFPDGYRDESPAPAYEERRAYMGEVGA